MGQRRQQILFEGKDGDEKRAKSKINVDRNIVEMPWIYFDVMHSVFTLSLSLSHSHTEIYALQQCKAKKYSTEQKLFGWAAFPLLRRGFHGSSNVNVSVRFVFCVRSSFTWGGAVRKVSREPKNSEHIYLLNIRFPPNSYASDTVIYENIT